MKNIALIKSFVSSITSTNNTETINSRIATLIQCLPENSRENALAILTGDAELTVRPVEQVEIKSTDAIECMFEDTPTVDLLAGTINCRISYAKNVKRWYKSAEDVQSNRNASYYQHDDYTIEYDTIEHYSTNNTFDLVEWNSGVIAFK